MINVLKIEFKNIIANYINETYHDMIDISVEEPKRIDQGDLAIPLFIISKRLKKPLLDIYNELLSLLNKHSLIQEILFINGFLNINLKREKIAIDILLKAHQKNYGSSEIGSNKTIVIDYSSPNIAKPFSIGHLRSTIIGMSLTRIYRKCGYKTVSINHLGDWGTQFGKVIVAYQKWGTPELVKNNPLLELSKLYVRFHNEVKNNPSLEDEARKVFNALENGNQEYLELWKYFKDESIKEAMKLYELMDVSFDSYDGEAFFNDKMDDIIQELEQKQLLVLDDGAKVVYLEDNLPPALIKRSDGASLYITRDLAAVFYRLKKYHFDKCLYVVGSEQKLHFTQLKSVLTKMGYDLNNQIIHVNFGLVLKDGKKMSTREGKIVTLYAVLDEAIKLALATIINKNPNLENKEETAKKIGIGAVMFNDLKNHRTLDIDFNLDLMLKFEGQTGPYLQYTAVRIASILRENQYETDFNSQIFIQQHYYDLIKLIDAYQETILLAMNENAPSIIAKYLLLLAQTFNAFYGIEKIVCENIQIKNANLLLSSAVKLILEDGMYLLGLKPLERM